MIKSIENINWRKNKNYERQKASRAYRRSIGKQHAYDAIGAHQFGVLTHFGLREYHNILDIGCGALRAGRLLIPYLQEGKYFGIEPNERVVRLGLLIEVGEEMATMKKPLFSNDANFSLTEFGQKFDFLFAYSIFSHAPQSQITRCLSEASQSMHQDSIFLATYLRGDEDYEGDTWCPSPEYIKQKRSLPEEERRAIKTKPVATYRFETMAKLANDSGLEIEGIPRKHTNNFGPPTGTEFGKQRWLKITKP